MAQMHGVIVVPAEHHVPDAALAERQQHGRRLGREAGVEDERQRREQHAQPLDLPITRRSRQQRIHHRQLDRAAADRGEHSVPARRVQHSEPRRGRAAQLMKLNPRDGG